MAIDVIDLRSFYSSSLGDVARRVVHKIVRQRFANCSGYSISESAMQRPISKFPRGSGAGACFHAGRTRRGELACLGFVVFGAYRNNIMPLPNSCIDRALVIHALEIIEHPRDLLAEIWRILTPGGGSSSWCHAVPALGPARPEPLGMGGPIRAANWPNCCGNVCFPRRIGRKRFTFRHSSTGRGCGRPRLSKMSRSAFATRRWSFDRRGHQALVPAHYRAQSLAYAAPSHQPVLVPETGRRFASAFGLPGAASIDRRHRLYNRALAHFRVRFGYTQHDAGSWRILAV